MKKLYFAVFIFLIFSCDNGTDNFDDYYCLKQTNTELQHSTLTEVNPYLFRFKADSLITFHYENKLRGVDLQKGKEIFNLQLPIQKGFYYRDHLYHNQDSIFICSIINNNMYILLMNSNGHVVNKWDISCKAQSIPNGLFYINARYSHPMELRGSTLYCQGSYHINPGLEIEQQIPIEVSLDINSGQIEQFGDLPDNYKNGDFYGNHQYEYSRQINEKSEFVFSFPSCHNLYVYDTNGYLLRTINCQSNYIKRFEPIHRGSYNNIQTIIDAYAYNAQYSDFVYDKYRKRYYRIALHKLNKFDESNNINDVNMRSWSIMILDEDLKLITELEMPENQFLKRLFFIEEGLVMICKDNNTYIYNSYTLCKK